MKEMNDEEIQRLLENELTVKQRSLSADKQKNLEQYRFLFAKLSEEPKEGLPFNFASKVKKRLQQKLNRKKDIRFYLISIAALILGFVAFYELLLVINANSGNLFIITMLRFKWIFISGTVLFLGFLFCDQKFIKDKIIEG